MKKKRQVSLTTLFYYLLHITKPFYKHILLIVFLVFLEALISIVFLSDALESFVDTINENAPRHTLIKRVTKPALYFLLLQILTEFMIRSQDYIMYIKVTPTLRQHTINHSMNSMLKKNYQRYQKEHLGTLSENIMQSTSATVKTIETCVAKISFLLFTILLVNYKISQVNLLLIPCYLFFSLFVTAFLFSFNKKQAYLSARFSHRRASVAGYIVDVIRNMLLVKIHTAKKQEQRNMHRLLNPMNTAEKKAERNCLSTFFSIDIAYFILQSSTISLLLIIASNSDTISLGTIVAVLYINQTLVDTVWYDMDDMSLLSKNVGDIKQALSTIIQDKKQIQDHIPKKSIVLQTGRIQFNNVTFSFSNPKKTLFKEFSVTVSPNQKIGIVGHSGAGKSSFVKLLLRLYEVQQGQICIDNQNIAKVTKDSLWHSIGFIPQHPMLFARSIKENIQYGKRDATSAEIIKAARQAHAHDFIMATPKGYHTLIGAQGIQLSSGEQQRLAIARVFLKNPPILILDEATSHLDALTEAQIQDALSLLMQNRTTLVIAHRLTTIMQMDRILVFDKGKIIEDGSHAQLVNKGGLYTRLWKTQSHGFLGDNSTDLKQKPR